MSAWSRKCRSALFIQQALTLEGKSSLDHHHVNNFCVSARSRLHEQLPDQSQALHLPQAVYRVLKLGHPLRVTAEGLVDNDSTCDLFQEVKKW